MTGNSARLANRWSAAEDGIVRRLYPAGGVEAVAPLLPGRTVAAIRWRAGVLHATRPLNHSPAGPREHPCSKPRAVLVRTRRRCLMCRQAFTSDGAGHRVCKTCKATPAWRAGTDGGAHGFGGGGRVRAAGAQP